MKREVKTKTDAGNKTTLSTYLNGQLKDSIIRHKKVNFDQVGIDETEQTDLNMKPEQSKDTSHNISAGTHIFLLKTQKFGYVKSTESDNKYILVVNEKEEEMSLESKDYDIIWSNQVSI